MDRNAGFAQHGLRNAGQLVCIDPSLGIAEFISNSAILRTIRYLRRAHGCALGRPKARKMADFRAKSAKVTGVPVELMSDYIAQST